MGYIQNAKPGIGAVGEYQAAGRPWLKTVTVPVGANHGNTAANANVDEIRVDFPAITSKLTIRNRSTAAPVYVHFASLATTHDGAVAGDDNSAVKTTKNYAIIPHKANATADANVLELNVKCRFVYLSSSGTPGADAVDVIAELTNIQEPYDLNKRGLSGVTT